MRVVWFLRARNDRISQIEYIGLRNPAAAAEQELLIDKATRRLNDFPQLGRLGKRKQTRELVIPGTSFIAVYRIIASRQEIHIIRLVHARQKYPPNPKSE